MGAVRHGTVLASKSRMRHARFPGPTLPLAFLLTACSPERPPTSGDLLFTRHCASCHGTDGKGNGPLAASLNTPPTDLTTIQARTGGVWDGAAVMGVIDGRRRVAAHGPREMPVWGAVFVDEVRDDGGGYAELTALYAGKALTDHVQALQGR